MNFDLNLYRDVNEINGDNNKCELWLDELDVLNGKLKCIFREEYNDKFAKKVNAISLNIADLMNKLRQRLMELFHDDAENSRKTEEERARLEKEKAVTEHARQEAEEDKARAEKEVEDAEGIAGLLNLQCEIKKRCEHLLSHCNMDLSNLSDYKILDLKRNSFNLTTEFNLIKVTSFSKFAPHCDMEMIELRTLRDDTAAKLAAFAKNLEQAIEDGDLNEKKVKLGLGLRIHIAKFKGYNSELDIYTFRAEKLIEPILQRKLWVDYLKRNCLEGMARTIVGNIENIDEVWKQHKNSPTE